MAIRQPHLVWITRSRRISWLCRSGGRRGLRLCDEPNGNAIDRRPAGCGPQRRAIFRYSGFLSRDGTTTSRLVRESRGGKNQSRTSDLPIPLRVAHSCGWFIATGGQRVLESGSTGSHVGGPASDCRPVSRPLLKSVAVYPEAYGQTPS